jgi:hypothetical protein
MLDRLSERTPELVVLTLALLLGIGAVLLGSGGGSSPTDARAGSVSHARIALIERRVERLRGLRFRHPVPVAVVSPAQARREGLAEYDRSQSPGRQRAGEELLKLLGLLPRDADARGIEATVFGQQVAGYYDPRRKRLALVRGAGVDDVTLAHELTHALEDQHFDLRRLARGGGDDRSTAEQALVEGSATFVTERYAARWPSATPLGDALAGLTQTTGGTPLPAYTMRALVFPYFQGERFVQRLRALDGGWALVDEAEGRRPPMTTAEIVDPRRWLHAQRPLPVALAVTSLAGWRRLAGSTVGAEDLAALLAPQSGPQPARTLTAGWRGGRYALWRRGRLGSTACAAPCRARDALALAVRMSGGAQARALAAALGAWLAQGLHARVAGGGLWRLPGGSAGAVRVGGDVVRAALAPSATLARRLVR